MSGVLPRLEPHREVLSNGLVLITNRNPDTPSVALRGLRGAGACRDPFGREGLAALTARMLRRGAGARTATEIAAAVEDRGASFYFSTGTEAGGFGAKCLGRDLGRVLELLQVQLEQPTFPESDLEKVREEVLTGLAEDEDSPRVRADRALRRRLYPETHPYARPTSGSPETVRTLSRAECRAFHAEHTAPEGMLVCLSGDLDRDEARAALERWLIGRRAPSFVPPPLEPPVVPTLPDRISLPHKSQAALLLGVPGIGFLDPDYFALSLLTLILGGLGLMGRLGERLREREGVVYATGCQVVSRLWAGEWVASAAVGPEHVERARELILEEVARVRTERVEEQELADAQEYKIGSLPLRLETNDGLASYLLNCEYYGLGLDYVERYPALVRAETRERLQEVAVRYLDPAGFHTAMAGPV